MADEWMVEAETVLGGLWKRCASKQEAERVVKEWREHGVHEEGKGGIMARGIGGISISGPEGVTIYPAPSSLASHARS
jgi:hypothetical protein